MAREVWVLLAMVCTGALSGVLFDLMRAIRSNFKGTVMAAVTDAVYWMAVSVFVWYTLLIFYDGQIRFFEFLGLGIGLVLYFLLLSRLILRIFIGIFKLFFKILLTPAGFLYKIIRRMLLCLNSLKIVRKGN